MQPVNDQLSESVINASIDSLIAVDIHLNITLWNDTTALWFGKSADETVGKYFFEVFPESAHTPLFHNAFGHAMKGRKSFFKVDHDFYLKGYFEIHYVPLFASDGTVKGMLQILRDVAHRIKIEQELNELNRELFLRYAALERANLEMGTFAKIASHDLKEPLRKINTFADMILSQDGAQLSERSKHHFQRLLKSAERMRMLTNDLAAFSEVSTVNERPARVNLNAVLDMAMEPYQHMVANNRLQFSADNLPDISGYSGALVLLLRQLISNALKFQPPNALPVIRITHRICAGKDLNHPQAMPDRYYHELSVQDNGIGFDGQYKDRIFEMFQRLHPDGLFKGSGIGLSIARKIAYLHNGFITAESTPGAGSIFRCYLQEDSLA